MNRNQEIRDKLDRWYAGVTSPDEERRLKELLATTAPLPADLETERRLFSDMSEAAVDTVDMPAEYAARIESALEAEIAREATVRRNGTWPWRRRLLTVGGAAACLLAAWFGFRTINGPNIAEENVQVRYANVEKPVANEKIIAVAPTRENQPGSEQGVSPVRTSSPTHTLAKAPKKEAPSTHYGAVSDRRNDEYDNLRDVLTDPDDDMYLSPEEESRLIAANYHVVDNEQEAYAMLNSVFGRLEGNVARESYKMQDISTQYEMEVTRVSY